MNFSKIDHKFVSKYLNIYSYHSFYIHIISFHGTILKFHHVVPDIIVYFWYILFTFLLCYRLWSFLFLFVQLIFFPFFEHLSFLFRLFIYFFLLHCVFLLISFCLSIIVKIFKFLQ